MVDPTAPRSQAASARPLCLRFISGKYQGGEFPVASGREILIGRSSDLDMVLVEDMVSRKHARIAFESGRMFIEDLGSTNGTFVNGEKVQRAWLKEGDRILVGTSILKLAVPEGAALPTEAEARQTLEEAGLRRTTSTTRTMSGDIEEIPLPDLLQLLSTSKKSGTLVVRTRDDMGRIHLRKGAIYWATLNDLHDLVPIKVVFRMLTWQKGTFDLEPPDSRTFPDGVDLPVPQVLMDSMRQLDELARIRDRLPDLDARLAVAAPLIPPLRDLGPKELDVLQLAHNSKSFEEVLNRSLATDLETAELVLKLLEAGYLRSG